MKAAPLSKTERRRRKTEWARRSRANIRKAEGRRPANEFPPKFIPMPWPLVPPRGRVFDPDEVVHGGDIWRGVWLTYTLEPAGFISMAIER